MATLRKVKTSRKKKTSQEAVAWVQVDDDDELVQGDGREMEKNRYYSVMSLLDGLDVRGKEE